LYSLPYDRAEPAQKTIRKVRSAWSKEQEVRFDGGKIAECVPPQNPQVHCTRPDVLVSLDDTIRNTAPGPILEADAGPIRGGLPILALIQALKPRWATGSASSAP
jgi:hypothetical protein